MSNSDQSAQPPPWLFASFGVSAAVAGFFLGQALTQGQLHRQIELTNRSIANAQTCVAVLKKATGQ